jgi:hypothetical protein
LTLWKTNLIGLGVFFACLLPDILYSGINSDWDVICDVLAATQRYVFESRTTREGLFVALGLRTGCVFGIAPFLLDAAWEARVPIDIGGVRKDSIVQYSLLLDEAGVVFLE